MAIVDELAGGGVKAIAGAFTSILDEFHLNPEKKAEIQSQIAAAAAQDEQSRRDLEAKLNQIASDNIRQETSSSDWFVRRARPGFLWAMTIAIGFNLYLPLVSQFFGYHMQPLVIDREYFLLFRDAFVGYTIARTVEKAKGMD